MNIKVASSTVSEKSINKHGVDQYPPVLDPPEYITGVDMNNNKWLIEPKPHTRAVDFMVSEKTCVLLWVCGRK